VLKVVRDPQNPVPVNNVVRLLRAFAATAPSKNDPATLIAAVLHGRQPTLTATLFVCQRSNAPATAPKATQAAADARAAAQAAKAAAETAAQQAAQARAAAEEQARLASQARAAAERAREAASAAKEAAEAAADDAARKVDEAEAYLAEVKSRPGSAHGAVWFMERELHEAKKYMPTRKGGISK